MSTQNISQSDIAFIENNFKVVYQPYINYLYRYNRFYTTFKKLILIIGLNNANTALVRLSNCKDDKLRIRLRSIGIIDFYRK